MDTEILEALHKFDRRVDERADEMRAQLDRVGEIVSRLDRDLSRIETAINGNGNPGIKTRLARLERSEPGFGGLSQRLVLPLLLAPWLVVLALVIVLAESQGIGLLELIGKFF